MSLTMPSGTVVTASTGVIARQFGDYEMQIEFETSGSPASLTMKMSKLPVMEQKIDLQIETEDLSEVKINLSDIEFTVFDRLSDGTSLIDRISGLDVGDAIKITSTVNSGNDYFLATRSTCKYDWKSRSVTIKAVSPLRYDNVITSFDPSAYILQSNSSPSWIFPKDLIDSFLSSQGSGGSNFILGSYFTSTKSVPPTSDELAFRYAHVDPVNLGATTAYQNAQDLCLRLAIQEGAYIGSLFGAKYYVRRNYATESSGHYVDITADDIESYELVPNERSVRQYNTLFFFRDQFNQPNSITPYQSEQEVAIFGAFDVTLDYRLQGGNQRLEGIEFVTGIPGYWEAVGSSDSLTLIEALNAAVKVPSRQSYASALGIAQSNNISYNEMFKVKLTLLGIDSVLPYQFIKFATSINPFLDNRKLRPSSVKYNLEQDKVEVEGYFIG